MRDRKNLRTRLVPIAGLLAVAAIVTVLWLNFRPQSAQAGQLSQTDIEAKAIAYAQANGLQGAPTSIQSKQITFAEYNARLNPLSHDPTPGDTLVWIVILKGKVLAQWPGMSGQTNPPQFDNMWVLLTTRGDIRGMGAQAPGYELDLSKPPTPFKGYPTATGEKGGFTPQPQRTPTPTATRPIVTPVVATPRPYP